MLGTQRNEEQRVTINAFLAENKRDITKNHFRKAKNVEVEKPATTMKDADADSYPEPSNTWNTFIIAGQPKSLARPNISSRRSPVRLFDPNKRSKALFKKKLDEQVLGQKNNTPPPQPLYPGGIPVCVEIIFCLRRPNGHFINNGKGGRALDRLKATAHFLWPTTPDVDNLGKFVLDAAQNCLYKNDSQVVQLKLRKVYASDDGSTQIRIRQTRKEELSQCNEECGGPSSL